MRKYILPAFVRALLMSVSIYIILLAGLVIWKLLLESYLWGIFMISFGVFVFTFIHELLKRYDK